LHLGKDLAVSFSYCYESPGDKHRALGFSTSRVSVRTSWITPDGRYPLPFCSLKSGKCSDFPPRHNAEALVGAITRLIRTILLYHIVILCQGIGKRLKKS